MPSRRRPAHRPVEPHPVRVTIVRRARGSLGG
jgi:hypothetical protein